MENFIGGLTVVMYAYLAIAFIKFMLAAGTLGAAAGTYFKLLGRRGYSPKLWECYLICAGVLLSTVLIAWPRGLLTERWRFFLVYSRYGTIRDTVRTVRAFS